MVRIQPGVVIVALAGGGFDLVAEIRNVARLVGIVRDALRRRPGGPANELGLGDGTPGYRGGGKYTANKHTDGLQPQ